MYLKFCKNFADLAAFQNRPWAPTWRKQGWIPWRTISWWKASLSPQKEIWAFFWTFSFHFLSFNGVFLTLKCRTLVLKHLHGDRAAAILLKIYPSLRFPNMVKVNIHEHWTRVTRFNPSFNPLWVSAVVQNSSPVLMRLTYSLRKLSILLFFLVYGLNFYYRCWRKLYRVWLLHLAFRYFAVLNSSS